MKKIIFILVITLWSGLLILLSFWRGILDEKVTPVTIDFTEWEKLFVWNTDKKSFMETSLTGSREGGDTFYFHRLSPVDGIYYKSTDKSPITIIKKWGTNIVTFGSGIFISQIQTGLEKYEFQLSNMTLSPKGRGVFLVENTTEQTKVFSFDTFLDTELITEPNRTHVATFTLFPSLLFKHDAKNTLELKEADILRISLIDSIRYIDMKTKEDSKTLFSWESTSQNEIFLAEAQKDITARIHAFVEIHTSIIEQNNNKTPEDFLLNTTSTLVINNSKKEALLKNELVNNVQKLLTNPSQKQNITATKNTISEIQKLGPEAYSGELSLLKQYYYITLFSHFVNKNNLFDFSSKESPLLSLVKELSTSTNIQSKLWESGEYYIHLSNLFSVYYFLTLSTQELNNSLENILQKTLDNKALTKDEFLPFVFFVTQYLSTGPILPNEDSMKTISHLFQITNDYYSYNKSDAVKLATITSTTFYNYTRIFTKMYSLFLDTYIDTVPEGLILKEKYIKGEDTIVDIDQNFIDTFTRVMEEVEKDIDTKKTTLFLKDSWESNSQIIDSYTLLKKTLASFNVIKSMFRNYPQYLNDFHLNDRNKLTKSIVLEKRNELSMERLITYLEDFNNLDIPSLHVANNFQKDGFYEIQVQILGSTFNFKLWEQDHVLSDLSYTDTRGTKHTFPNITIVLDQKEKQLKELSSWADNPDLKYKYDFKNFFEVTFLKWETVSASDTQTKTTNPITIISSTTPELQLFIQKELLEKEFKNIADFLPIGFTSINASINNDGNYVITLSNIDKTFSENGKSYSIKLGGKYIFNRHTFSRLTFQVKKEGNIGWYEFGGTSIEILPARISLLSLSDSLKDLGSYIGTIQSSYTNQQSIIIDLAGKKVLLDNVPHITQFPTP